uniref:Highly derived d5-like helicase-primase: PROVISIONAL n=1 Tax=Steinernema glaseri TaxID=37863 RepID=A0A1I8AIP0_9BILA
MDTVPATFVDSVLHLYGYGYGFHRKLPAAWARRGQAYLKKRGSLILTYAPSDLQNHALPWTLRYKISDFDHIEDRSLSREVIREMAKSIACLKFDITYKAHLTAHYVQWPSITDDEVTFRLLTNLQAPKKELLLELNFVSQWYTELGARYDHFWNSFTSVSLAKTLRYTAPIGNITAFIQFMKNVVPKSRLRFINIYWKSIEPDTVQAIARGTPEETVPTSFWMDYMLSESCTGFNFHLESEITSGVIARWKEMDPRRLPQKIFTKVTLHKEDARQFGFTEFSMKTINARLLDTIKRKISLRSAHSGNKIHIQYIEHPIYQNFRIYAISTPRRPMETEGETRTKIDSLSECTLLIE